MKHLSQLTLVLLLTGCASTSRVARIDNALLSELPASSMAGIVEARATKDTAEDAVAKAERDEQWAKEQVEQTRSNLKVARTELDDAKLAMVLAERSGTVAQLEAAKKAFAYSSAHSDEVRDLLALRKREFEHSKLLRKVAEEELRLKYAQLELEKAEAVVVLDRVAAQQVPVKDYRKQVRYHETEVGVARIRAEAAGSEADDARQVADESHSRAVALRKAMQG